MAIRFGQYDLGAVRHFLAEIGRTPGAAAERLLLRSRKRLAVGYVGWIGHSNLGDEVLFQVIKKALHEFDLIPVLPAPGERMLTDFGLGGRRMFRAVLLGGGTLINPAYLATARLIQELRLPLYSVGTGVGSSGFGMPLDSSSYLEWADILGGSPMLSVRGPISAKRLRDSGVPGAEVIGDPALGVTPDSLPKFRTRKQLVINLAQEPAVEYGTGEFRIFSDIGEIASHFLQDGGELLGVALGSRDRSTLERFQAVHKLHGMRIEDHRSSGNRLLTAIEGSTALIGVRLHSAVLACCVGVPAILLAYRSKCQDFMNSMNLDAFAVPLGESAGPQLRARFRQILADPALGEQIYRQAIFWKRKQEDYYSRLAARLAAGWAGFDRRDEASAGRDRG